MANVNIVIVSCRVGSESGLSVSCRAQHVARSQQLFCILAIKASRTLRGVALACAEKQSLTLVWRREKKPSSGSPAKRRIISLARPMTSHFCDRRSMARSDSNRLGVAAGRLASHRSVAVMNSLRPHGDVHNGAASRIA